MKTASFFLAVGLFGAAPGIAQDNLPSGSFLDDGVALDVTENGFNFILEQVLAFIPPDLTIGSIPEQEIADLFFCTQNVSLDNLIVHTQLNHVTAEAGPDSLELVVNLDLWLNDPSNPAVVNLTGCIGYTCFLHTDPATVEVRIPITLALATNDLGDPFVDVTFGALTHNLDTALDGAIHMTDCAIGDINEFLDTIGFNLFDLVIDQFIGQLESQLTDQLASLEVTAEEALAALWLADSIDALGATLDYQIEPTAIEHEDEGLRIVLGGAFDAAPAPCVATRPDPGFQYTQSAIPPLTSTIPATQAGYHLAVLPSDDLVNGALYAAWRGGVLCYAVADLGGTSLSTSYLGLLLGTENQEALDALFFLGEVPMMIRIAPDSAPVARFDGDHDLNVDVIGLNVEFYPLMQDRFTRLAAVAIDVHAGIDVSIDTTGALSLAIDLDTDNLNPRVSYNEIAPGLNPALEQNFPNFLGVILDTVAGSLLSGVSFALPTFSGQGLTALDTYPLGEVPLFDWLGAYATLGPSTGGEGSGCDSCGGSGCGAEGCGGAGCGDTGGCDAQTLISESGCSGGASPVPGDTGCTGCRLVARRDGTGRWILKVNQQGASLRTRSLPAGPAMVFLVPLLLRLRRRR